VGGEDGCSPGIVFCRVLTIARLVTEQHGAPRHRCGYGMPGSDPRPPNRTLQYCSCVCSHHALAHLPTGGDEDWQRLYSFVDTTGLGDEEAALKWIEAALGRGLPRPLHAALHSGAALCQLLSLIEPGIVPAAQCKESGKPFEQMACIDAYLKGCGKLGVKLNFMTVDLHESRDLKAVIRQIWALAPVARKATAFPGPQLGSEKMQAEAKEKWEAAKAAADKRVEQEERRIRKMEREVRRAGSRPTHLLGNHMRLGRTARLLRKPGCSSNMSTLLD
jgi:hypothetical protein